MANFASPSLWQAFSSIACALPIRGKERVLRGLLSMVDGDVEVVVGGVRMRLDVRDYIQRCVFLGCLEIEDGKRAREILRRGDGVIDVGGNCGGLAAIYSTCVGLTGMVLAFEPNARLWEKLDFILARNTLPQLTVRKVALGDAPGELQLYLPPAGNSNEDATMVFMEGRTSASVAVRRLDDELALYPDRVWKLMKVDVEGFEPKVLRGAENALSAGRIEYLLIEFNTYFLQAQETSAPALWDYILSLGFEPLQEMPTFSYPSLHNLWFRHRNFSGSA